MFAVFATVLCLLSVSQSAPLACENLVRPVEQLDPPFFEGRWVLVAGSLNSSEDAAVLKRGDSITFDFSNSTSIQTVKHDDQCQLYRLKSTVEGHTLKLSSGSFNYTVTLLQTSCPDCAVIRLDLVSSSRESVDVYLVSRRREVEQKEMEEYKAQLECLNMPAPTVMDPTKELCPASP